MSLGCRNWGYSSDFYDNIYEQTIVPVIPMGKAENGAQQFGLENKEFYLIATAAAGRSAMERTIDGLRGYLECLPGAKEMGVVYGAGAWQLGDIQENPAMKEAPIRWTKISADTEMNRKGALTHEKISSNHSFFRSGPFFGCLRQ